MTSTEDEHYRRLAATYERNWANRPDYVEWMADRIFAWLEPSPQERFVDIGAGTGLFLRRLMEHASAENPIVCVDPSQPMLDRLPDDARLSPLCATAEQIASGEVALPYEQVDAFTFKESIHHVRDIPQTLRGLAERLSPKGRVLIVTLPPRLDYPLFPAALDRFAERQPALEDLVAALETAGLRTECRIEEYTVTIDRDQWVDLVRNQWMSVLSSFSAEEIEAGVAYIESRYPEGVLRYQDRFGFIRGVQS